MKQVLSINAVPASLTGSFQLTNGNVVVLSQGNVTLVLQNNMPRTTLRNGTYELVDGNKITIHKNAVTSIIRKGSVAMAKKVPAKAKVKAVPKEKASDMTNRLLMMIINHLGIMAPTVSEPATESVAA